MIGESQIEQLALLFPATEGLGEAVHTPGRLGRSFFRGLPGVLWSPD
jgi:hypothetical protein